MRTGVVFGEELAALRKTIADAQIDEKAEWHATAEAVDALPHGTIGVDAEGDAWNLVSTGEHGGAVWKIASYRKKVHPLNCPPFTVLYVPESEA